MKSTPAYILRNCAMWVNEDLKVGQVSEVTIPAFKVKTDTVRNAGMVRERQVALGYETDDVKFKMTGIDPNTLSNVVGKPGDERSIMVTGALVDEDGTSNNITVYMRGFFKQFDLGSWKPGDKNEPEYEFAWNSLNVEIGGQEIVKADDFDVSINGVSQTGDIRSLLLI